MPSLRRVGYVVALCIAIAGVCLAVWYQAMLQPVDPASQLKVKVEISKGEGLVEIAQSLEKAGVIRNRHAFRLFVEINRVKGELQAGSYTFSPIQSTPAIIEQLTSGKTDASNLTIPPGLTLKQISRILLEYGYAQAEIDAAFTVQYDHPVLRDKPADQGLEGYIFPETYQITAGTSLRTVFTKGFDELYGSLESSGAIEAFSREGLTIHQGLALASIIQEEHSDVGEQRQVAQVFLRRLHIGMVLGSDATFMYAAEQLGVEPRVSLESPYNTRIHPGLPPGPIANFTRSSLEAIANPAPGDYLYFVSGDDGRNYYARTEEEHEANVAAHCTTLCSEISQ